MPSGDDVIANRAERKEKRENQRTRRANLKPFPLGHYIRIHEHVNLSMFAILLATKADLIPLIGHLHHLSVSGCRRQPTATARNQWDPKVGWYNRRAEAYPSMPGISLSRQLFPTRASLVRQHR